MTALPEKCGTCNGSGVARSVGGDYPCGACKGTGEAQLTHDELAVLERVVAVGVVIVYEALAPEDLIVRACRKLGLEPADPQGRKLLP